MGDPKPSSSESSEMMRIDFVRDKSSARRLLSRLLVELVGVRKSDDCTEVWPSVDD
jgi:hypothetical protein